MVTPRAIIPGLLLGGLIVIEVLGGNPISNSAQSQHQLTQNETQLILSILRGNGTDSSTGLTQSEPIASGTSFLDLSLPGDPNQLIADATDAYGTSIGTKQLPLSQAPDSSSVLNEVLPPTSTPLYFAYQDGGVAWYQKPGNVLVLMPNDTIRSFNSSTGAETDWLQDKLARLPISDANAYQSYQTTYHAKIVAETKTWSLFEFPSGGVLKMMKPQYITGASAAPSVPTSYGNLPNILPGYGN